MAGSTVENVSLIFHTQGISAFEVDWHLHLHKGTTSKDEHLPGTAFSELDPALTNAALGFSDFDSWASAEWGAPWDNQSASWQECAHEHMKALETASGR